MKLSAETTAQLRSLVEGACAGSEPSVPGATVVVMDRAGTELFAHAAGRRGLNSRGPSSAMTAESVYWLASCSKVVTGMAVMQLVERGVLRLDDAEQVEGELVPELRQLQVLRADGDGGLEPRRKAITLRMLLTHTAGFGYSFANERLRDHSHPVGLDEFSADFRDMLQPLLFQPGDGWEYGIGIDWAGLVLERATGQKLNEYLHEHLFGPLGLTSTSMLPTPAMKARLAHMHQRDPHDGRLRPRDHLMGRVLRAETAEEAARCFHSGGGGLFAKPQEFARILAVLLNDGTCPVTQTKVLSKSTVEHMFTNQLPATLSATFARQGLAAAKPELCTATPELHPIPPQLGGQGWGLTFLLTPSLTGRPAGSAFWCGIANLFYWIDRENGVTGFVASQILPSGDPAVMTLWAGVEMAVYGDLARHASVA